MTRGPSKEPQIIGYHMVQVYVTPLKVLGILENLWATENWNVFLEMRANTRKSLHTPQCSQVMEKLCCTTQPKIIDKSHKAPTGKMESCVFRSRNCRAKSKP